MSTTTNTLDARMPEAVRQPSPVENWLNAQAAEPTPYRGRHRRRPDAEDDPQNAHATSA